MAIHKGLDGVYVKESRICFIDGENSRLYYRGYNIEELAKRSTYEEVAFLLIFGRLPTKRELDEFKANMAESRALPPEALSMLKLFPPTSHPMDVLRTMVSALSVKDPELFDDSPEANARKCIRILARAPTIATAFERIRKGRPPVQPNTAHSHASSFLYTLKGEEPSASDARVMDVAMILHAEHEVNASTFACMVVASTLADMYSAITAGIGALRGSLHGGANEAALKMLLEVGSPEKAEEFVNKTLDSKKRIMGFGHRVYRNYDPRYMVLKDVAATLSKEKGRESLYETAARLEEAALKKLAPMNIYPNVDYYSGIVFHLLGVPFELFTPIFAISRIAGWAAHILEYLENNRLIRPRSYYTGELDLKYVPIEQRD